MLLSSIHPCLSCRTHVNVISGRNGSGKSAVLQAMQAALGSKAKETGRGDNFRELIRTGRQEARVKVGLRLDVLCLPQTVFLFCSVCTPSNPWLAQSAHGQPIHSLLVLCACVGA